MTNHLKAMIPSMKSSDWILSYRLKYGADLHKISSFPTNIILLENLPIIYRDRSQHWQGGS